MWYFNSKNKNVTNSSRQIPKSSKLVNEKFSWDDGQQSLFSKWHCHVGVYEIIHFASQQKLSMRLFGVRGEKGQVVGCNSSLREGKFGRSKQDLGVVSRHVRPDEARTALWIALWKVGRTCYNYISRILVHHHWSQFLLETTRPSISHSQLLSLLSFVFGT